MSDRSIALMGGPVVARWERRPPAWLRSAVDGSGRLAAPLALLDYGPEVSDLGPRTVLGANMAARRETLARIGGFARHLGKLRGTLLSGEDHDLCRRVQAAGLRAIYDPAAPVTHWVPTTRMRVSYYVSWFFWSGMTYAVLDAGSPEPLRSIGGVPLYLVKRAAIAPFAGAAAIAAGSTAGAIERLVDIAFFAGYAARRWRHASPRPLFRAREDRA